MGNCCSSKNGEGFPSDELGKKDAPKKRTISSGTLYSEHVNRINP